MFVFCILFKEEAKSVYLSEFLRQLAKNPTQVTLDLDSLKAFKDRPHEISTLKGHKSPVIALEVLQDGRLKSSSKTETFFWEKSSNGQFKNVTPKDEDEHFVINGYHNPKIVLIRGNKYTFDYSYSKATSPYEFYIHEGFFRQGKAAFRLFEDGVVRDETNNTVTFTVPGDAPPRLIYGPQPDGFQSHRTGEIAIEDKVTL